MQFYLANQDIINGLIERLEKYEKRAIRYGNLCNYYYKEGKKNWDMWCENCISAQKEWLKVKQTIDYLMLDLTGDTCTNEKKYEKFLDSVINKYGKGAEKRFERYYFDELIFERLKDEYDEKKNKDEDEDEKYMDKDEDEDEDEDEEDEENEDEDDYYDDYIDEDECEKEEEI